jgi:hypothetical protein
MTDMAAGRRAEGLTARVAAWIAQRQRQFSDQLHADGDALARERGWTITTTTGRFGFSGRVYRDPRFDQLADDGRRGEPHEPDDGWPTMTVHRGPGEGSCLDPTRTDPTLANRVRATPDRSTTTKGGT